MIKNYNSTDGVSVIELTVTSLDASNTDAFKDAVRKKGFFQKDR